MHRPVTLPAWAERAAGRQVVPFLLYVAGLPGRKGSSGCVLSKACNCDFSSWGFMFPSPRIRWTVVLPKPVAFANDCVLLVLASDYYDESDYIRNYDEYLKYVQDRDENSLL